MKTKIAFLLAAVLTAVFGFAASATSTGNSARATYTREAPRIYRVQFNPTYNPDGSVASIVMKTFIQRRFVNAADPNDVGGAAWDMQFDLDLLDAEHATKDYTADGKTVNGQQFAALMRKIILDEATSRGVE